MDSPTTNILSPWFDSSTSILLTQIAYLGGGMVVLIALFVLSNAYIFCNAHEDTRMRIPVIDGSEYLAALQSGLPFKERYDKVLRKDLNKYGLAKIDQLNVLHITSLPLVRQVLSLPQVFKKTVPDPDQVSSVEEDEFQSDPELLRRDISNSCDGDEWERHAKFVHKALSKVPVKKDMIIELLAIMETQLVGTVKIGPIIDNFVIDILGRYVLDMQLGMLSGYPEQWARLYQVLITPHLSKEDRAIKIRQLDELIFGMIEKCLNGKEKRNGNGTSPEVSSCVLWELMAANQDTNQILENEDIRNNIISIFISGHLPLTSALMSLFDAFARYPISDVKSAVYEVLRMSPPMPVLPGRRVHPDVDNQIILSPESKEILGKNGGAYLPNKHKGAYLKRGTGISVNVYGINMTESAFGENTGIFDESRWKDINDVEIDKDERWMTFGYGHRKCPGRHFAMEILMTAAKYIHERYELSIPSDSVHANKPVFESGGSFKLRDDLMITFKPK